MALLRAVCTRAKNISSKVSELAALQQTRSILIVSIHWYSVAFRVQKNTCQLPLIFVSFSPRLNWLRTLIEVNRGPFLLNTSNKLVSTNPTVLGMVLLRRQICRKQRNRSNSGRNERMLNLAFFILFQSFSHNDLLLYFWQRKIFKQFVSQLQSVKLLHFRTVSSKTLRLTTVNSQT